MSQNKQLSATEPAYPTVTFDINLGKTVRSIDFDLEGYTQYLREQGLNDDQINDLSVNFTNGGRFLGSGVYDPHGKQIGISVPRTRNIDRLLKHETQHAVDDAASRFTPYEHALAYVNNVGIAAGTLAIAASVGGNIANKHFHSEALHKVSRVMALGGMAAFAAGQAAHKFSPAEQRARQAGTKDAHSFVSVDKRPLHQQLRSLIP